MAFETTPIFVGQGQALNENDPYSLGEIFLFDEGDYLLDGVIPTLELSAQDRYYTTEQGDDLWNIAWSAYGDSKWYWIIAFANDIDFALDLPVGKTLTIPDLQKTKSSL